MSRGSLSFRFLGFPVSLHVSFFIVMALLAGGRADAAGIAIWVGVGLVSIFLHELGHAVIARVCGLSPSIAIYGFGGFTSWGKDPRPSNAQMIGIVLAGPATGIAVGFLGLVYFLVLPPDNRYLAYLANDWLFINIGWAVLNLLPILPLDGGQIMRSLWLILFGPGRERGPCVISMVVGALAAAAAFLAGWIFPGALALGFVLRNLQALQPPQANPAPPQPAAQDTPPLMLILAMALLLPGVQATRRDASLLLSLSQWWYQSVDAENTWIDLVPDGMIDQGDVLALAETWQAPVPTATPTATPAPQGHVLEVGPGRGYATIEAAMAAASAGDTILVYPRPQHQPYARVALYVEKPRLTFRAVPDGTATHVTLSGAGFNYSGVGHTPRAVVQFNRGADGCALEGFELTGAHNDSHNGAGVRINQANHTTIFHCDIHHNDMGVMSGGDGTDNAGLDQRLIECVIHENGDLADPGYNHNLYLGGASALLSGCEVYGSLTGHNVKSRAHHTRVEYSYIHHSANREFDLVDAADTARPDSDAVLLGNIMVKDPQCPGNRELVHFGQDGGGAHNGTLYLLHNSIVQPFISPVVTLSAAGAHAQLLGNLVGDGGSGQQNQVVLAVRAGAVIANATGAHNAYTSHFSGLDAGAGAVVLAAIPFVDPAAHNYHLSQAVAGVSGAGLPVQQWSFCPFPGGPTDSPLAWQYAHASRRQPRSDAPAPTLGGLAFP